jgi:hypothetical protein
VRVGLQERVSELVVPWPVLKLRQRRGEVVEVEAPAAIVEVDRSCLTSIEEEVLVVEIAVDEAEGAGHLGQRSRRRPNGLECPRGQRRVSLRNQRLHELERAVGVLRRRVIAATRERGGSRERTDLCSVGEGVDSWPEEPGRRSPRRRVLLQSTHKSADVAHVRGGETIVDESPVEPAQQDADVRLGHARIACDEHVRAVPRGDGFRYTHAGVASERVQPGHL